MRNAHEVATVLAPRSARSADACLPRLDTLRRDPQEAVGCPLHLLVGLIGACSVIKLATSENMPQACKGQYLPDTI